MISLIYVSTANKFMTPDELLELLKVSRDNNAAQNITGLLLYKGGNFMQVLEGSEKAVLDVYEKIKADSRHRNIILISSENLQARQFSTWKMGFQNLDEPAIQNEPGYSKFLQDEFTADLYRRQPSLANTMLMTFRDNMR